MIQWALVQNKGRASKLIQNLETVYILIPYIFFISYIYLVDKFANTTVGVSTLVEIIGFVLTWWKFGKVPIL